mmetsp:Transcript_60102/g.143220  ORF Transcript_60102/g.143220 Transcript_60102/m.143220 type:complete len:1011 (-) Transcript_60102:28-3060(-)
MLAVSPPEADEDGVGERTLRRALWKLYSASDAVPPAFRHGTSPTAVKALPARPASAPLGRGAGSGFSVAASAGRVRPQTATLVRMAGADPGTASAQKPFDGRRPVSAQSSSLALARRLGRNTVASSPNLHTQEVPSAGFRVGGMLVRAFGTDAAPAWKAGLCAPIDAVSLANSLPPQLRSLELDFNEGQLTDRDIEILAVGIPASLDALTLRFCGCSSVGDAALAALAKTTASSRLQRLHVDISGTAVSEEGLRLMLQALPVSLQDLELRLTGMPNFRSLAGLSWWFPPALRSLALILECSTDGDATALAKVIPRDLRVLKLDLHNCDQLTDAAMAVLAGSVSFTLSTLSLHFRMTTTSHITDAGLVPFSRQLGFMPSLQVCAFSLMGCGLISDEGVLQLAHALPAALDAFTLRCWFCRQLTDDLLDSLLDGRIGALPLSQLEVDFHHNAGKGKSLRWGNPSVDESVGPQVATREAPARKQGNSAADQALGLPLEFDMDEDRRREDAIRWRLRQLNANGPWQDRTKAPVVAARPLARFAPMQTIEAEVQTTTSELEQDIVRLAGAQNSSREQTKAPRPLSAPCQASRPAASALLNQDPSTMGKKVVDPSAIEQTLRQLSSLWERDSMFQWKRKLPGTKQIAGSAIGAKSQAAWLDGSRQQAGAEATSPSMPGASLELPPASCPISPAALPASPASLPAPAAAVTQVPIGSAAANTDAEAERAQRAKAELKLQEEQTGWLRERRQLLEKCERLEGENGQLRSQLHRNREPTALPPVSMLSSPNEPEAETQPESRSEQACALPESEPARKLFESREASPVPRPRKSKSQQMLPQVAGQSQQQPPPQQSAEFQPSLDSLTGEAAAQSRQEDPFATPQRRDSSQRASSVVQQAQERYDGPDSAAGGARLIPCATASDASHPEQDAPARPVQAMDSESVIEMGETMSPRTANAELQALSLQWSMDEAQNGSCLIAPVQSKVPGTFNMAVGFIMTCPLEEDGAESAHGSSACGTLA